MVSGLLSAYKGLKLINNRNSVKRVDMFIKCL